MIIVDYWWRVVIKNIKKKKDKVLAMNTKKDEISSPDHD